MDLRQIAQNKKAVILIALVSLALLSLLYGIFSRPGRRNTAPVRSIVTAFNKNKVSALPESSTPAFRRAKRTQFRSWKRSPFVPKGVPGTPYSKFALNGILASGKELKAMIGDAIVGKGDKINANTTVVEVMKDKVILNDGTKNFELKLEQ
ncbi:MAG: hypothetical protein WCY36_00785 [Candidatus Omnitrophota bacterium]